MQKKLIALAVAGLVSGAAFAQVAPNNVTLSGIIDMGYQYSWDHVYDAPSQQAFNDGGQDGSRVKLDGVEDLGNGLKVGFHTDWRFSTDVQNTWGTDNQNLFLSGGFGTITAGSFGAALDDINGYSEAGGMGWGNGVVGMFLSSGATKNGVKYNSPNFNGLDFMVGVSTNNANAQEALDSNVRAINARVSYVNGPVKAGFAMIREKVQGNTVDANGVDLAAGTPDNSNSRTEWLLSGSYNFGPVILGAGYSRTSYGNGDALGTIADLDANGSGAGDIMKKRTAYRINIGAPIGANDAIAFSYSRSKQKYEAVNDETDTFTGYGLSYTHNLSKRTNLYASYGKLRQDDKGTVVVNDYEQKFKIGLRHQF